MFGGLEFVPGYEKGYQACFWDHRLSHQKLNFIFAISRAKVWRTVLVSGITIGLLPCRPFESSILPTQNRVHGIVVLPLTTYFHALLKREYCFVKVRFFVFYLTKSTLRSQQFLNPFKHDVAQNTSVICFYYFVKEVVDYTLAFHSILKCLAVFLGRGATIPSIIHLIVWICFILFEFWYVLFDFLLVLMVILILLSTLKINPFKIDGQNAINWLWVDLAELPRFSFKRSSRSLFLATSG